MIITISGLPGSGKSTVARRLAQALDWPSYGMGQLWRDLARERGLTLPELQRQAEADPALDRSVDDKVRSLAQQDNVIIESRTAYHFVPRSFKIFLTVDPAEGARRIFNDLQNNSQRNEGDNLQSVTDVRQANERRMASDRRRYGQYYGIDVFDTSQFDFVLDTTDKTAEQVFALVNEAVKKSLGQS